MTTKKLTVTEERQALLDKAEKALFTAKDALQELYDDLEEKRANMEEHFSGTVRYSRFEACCGDLDEAISSLDGMEIGAMELP